jgi:branched-chain amino acid transport system substrate-binding protein
MLDPQTALPIVAGSKWAIRAEPGADSFMSGFPDIAAKDGQHSLAVVGVNNAFGKLCVQGQKAEAKKAGLDVVYSTLYSPESDLSSEAQAIKARRADAVSSCSFFTDGVAMTRALNQAGYRPKLFGVSIAPSEPTYRSSVGKLADNVISTTTWDPSLPTEGNEEFVKGFTEKMGHAPDYHAANNYAAMQALAAAVKDVNSTDQQAILDKLYSTTYKTVLGTFKLSGDALATGYSMYLYQLQDGKSKLIHPADVAQAKVKTPYGGS